MRDEVQLIARVESDLADRLERLKTATGISKQHMIRIAILEWLEDAERRNAKALAALG